MLPGAFITVVHTPSVEAHQEGINSDVWALYVFCIFLYILIPNSWSLLGNGSVVGGRAFTSGV